MTGEGVLIDSPAASLGVLLVAGLIDVILTMLVLLLLAIVLATSLIRVNEAVGASAVVIVIVLVYLVVPVTIETLSRGRSVGKLVMKLRVVRDDGGPIVFRHAFVRGLIALVEIHMFQGVPAVIAAMVSKRSKRLGDMAAGTYTVREETAMRLQYPPHMPPALQPWAAGADIAPLPDGLALAIRQFLLRSEQLSPSARMAVGSDLLHRTLALVSPPPPAHAPPDSVLAAVLAERRRRDAERLQRDAVTRARLLPPSV
ncbi:RDD family protein [Calidifontibacter sp. DB0510]|uniref:RDD family protein n=1 Tax=Metallococcus carri TaxID=1656884 RepID=A0A967E9M1_9MICO|nr:RDD family protein [Metallococcus carri]NOP38836.1 RDD family protein [Calidifontibacter sp. DB2511S]